MDSDVYIARLAGLCLRAPYERACKEAVEAIVNYGLTDARAHAVRMIDSSDLQAIKEHWGKVRKAIESLLKE